MASTLKEHRARRVLSAIRHGSSLPVITEVDGVRVFTKLHGTAQGPGALVAEILVARLAEAIGLRVPARSLVWLEPSIESVDHNDELRDLLDRSSGYNLGFALIDGARDLRPEEIATIDDDTAAAILWLDGLVMNPDRSARNPNLIWDRKGALWLIDHGAALGFQHNLARLTEESPRRTFSLSGHILAGRAALLPQWDPLLAAQLDRDLLHAAAAEIPDDFLRALVPGGQPAAIARRREAYAAFLWKRLKAPRPFV